jgi:hypothetical protein
MSEYVVVHLSPNYKCAHEDDAPILFESDCLAQAITYSSKRWDSEKVDIAVYQPRTEGYRQINRHPARDARGRFEVR